MQNKNQPATQIPNKMVIVKNNRQRSTAAAAAAVRPRAFAAMLALSVYPTQAFQPSAFLATPLQRRTHHNSYPVSGLSMRGWPSPWDMNCYNLQPFRRRGGKLMIFPPPGGFGFQDPPSSTTLQLGEPEVTDTEQDYKLTFALPVEVDELNGLNISISGRLLTVRAKATREETTGTDPRRRGHGGGHGGGSWFSRSSRTDTVARSFVIPEGVSTSGATTHTSGTSEGNTLEVRFKKLVVGDRSIDNTVSWADGRVPTGTTTKMSSVGTNETVRISSASTNYLSSLSSPTTSTATTAAADNKEARVPKGTAAVPEAAADPDSADAARPAPAKASGRRKPQSVLEALDQEFEEFAKLMWGEENVPQFPTQEEMEAKLEAAREARARRVMAMRRATMRTDVSDTDSAYVVRMTLPEGASRDNVKLTVSSDNTIRVSFSAEGYRQMYKDVRLPRDALFSDISAKFQENETENLGSGEHEKDQEQAAPAMDASVSALEISVGKATAPVPKTVEIM